MECHGFKHLNSHREANDMTDDEHKALMVPWRKELQNLCDELRVGPDFLRNADQFGVFIKNLPTLCVQMKIGKRNFLV